MAFTIGRRDRAFAGAWMDHREHVYVVNVILFGWHYQLTFKLLIDRWRR